MATTFVAAGTASATNGTAPTPTLPACNDGDIMICVAGGHAIGGNETISISAGWTELVNAVQPDGDIVHLAAWYRIKQAGDVAPTLSVTNHATGSSGESCIAHIAAFRGPTSADAPNAVDGINLVTNSIGPITGLTLAAGETVIVVAVKNESWTSVNTLSGDGLTWNEIGEPSTTSGSDAGLVWDYAIDGGSGTTVTSKTFTSVGSTIQDAAGVMLRLNNPVTNYTMTPSPVTIPFVVPAPTLVLDNTLTPSPVAMPLALTTPTLTMANTLAPDPVAMPLVVPAPTVVLDNTLAPDPMTIPFVLPDVTVLNEGGGDTFVTPGPVVLTLVVPAPTLEMGGVEATPDPVTMPLVLPDVAVALANTVSPDPTTMPLVLPDVVLVLGGVSATPDPVTMPLALPDVTLELGVTDYNMTPSPVTVAFTVPAPTLTMGGVSTTPSPVAVVFAIPVPLVQSGIFVFPDPVAMPFVVPSPSIAQALTLDPDPVTIRFVLPDVTLYLGTPPGAVGALVMDVHLVGGVVTGVELVGGLETSVRRVHGLRIYDETVGDVASPAGVTGNTWSEIQ